MSGTGRQPRVPDCRDGVRTLLTGLSGRARPTDRGAPVIIVPPSNRRRFRFARSVFRRTLADKTETGALFPSVPAFRLNGKSPEEGSMAQVEPYARSVNNRLTLQGPFLIFRRGMDFAATLRRRSNDSNCRRLTPHPRRERRSRCSPPCRPDSSSGWSVWRQGCQTTGPGPESPGRSDRGRSPRGCCRQSHSRNARICQTSR